MKFNPYKTRLLISGIILLLSLFAVSGAFYQISFLDIEIVPLCQRLICDFSIAAAVLFTIIAGLTVIFGRLYCSILCPFGILQEFFAFLRRKKKNSLQGNFGFKYLILGLSFGALISGSAILIRHVEPYTIFGSAVSLSLLGLIITFAVLALVFFKNRFFCTNICPAGAILGLISKFSLNKIYIDRDNCVSCGMCANSCPSGCIDSKDKAVDNETCIKCLKCLSVCHKNAVKYGAQPIKFNSKRRDLLWGIGALAFVGAGYAAGVNFTKNIAKKVKDIILPAGAINANRMANKCLNCNLCVTNCPNKILSKADENFSAVHINYESGKHYCEYNCHKCSEVCPSGAIKKISLGEKQNTRIGMASVNPHCVGCGICAKECPTGAIIVIDSKAVVDGSKCIGCGKCAAVCKPEAISIFAVNEQSKI